jgi:hypothetical protein
MSTHKYIRAQYERLLYTINECTAYSETEKERELRTIKFAFAQKNFLSSLDLLNEELNRTKERRDKLAQMNNEQKN